MMAEAQVHIKPETARFFLEAHDKLQLLEKKDSLTSERITTLESEIGFKDQIINSYKRDSIVHNSQTKLLEESLRLSNKEIRVQRKVTRVTKVAAIIVLGTILIIE
jgi:hypothetical protein